MNTVKVLGKPKCFSEENFNKLCDNYGRNDGIIISHFMALVTENGRKDSDASTGDTFVATIDELFKEVKPFMSRKDFLQSIQSLTWTYVRESNGIHLMLFTYGVDFPNILEKGNEEGEIHLSLRMTYLVYQDIEVSDNKYLKCKQTHVYLMKNTRNGYTKIGESIKPYYREKTLQSEEPEIELIFKSERCGVINETDLHRIFESKRIRGEWFDLTEKDIEYIINYNFK